MNPSWSTGALRRKSLVSLLAAGLLLLAMGAAGGTETQAAETQATDTVRQSLTKTEQAWLKDHPVIRVGQDPGWPPIEFADERGEPSGMAGDYLKLVEERLGVTFKREPKLSWQEAYARLKRWEIDMTTSVAATPERAKFWAFTRPYMNIPIVIVARTDVPYVGDMRELAGKKVAVVDGYAICDWVPKDFPAIELVKVKTVQEGLETLHRGDVFAYMENMLVVGYYLTKLKMTTTVKIVGTTPYVNAQSMAVRKDWAPLAGILDKVLNSISENERNEIYRRWLPVRYEHGFDYRFLWWALGIFAVILLVSGAWIRQLHREMASRKKAEAEAGASERRFRQLFNVAPMPLALSDREGALTLVNNQWEQTFGYTRKEIPTIKNWWRLAYPDPDYRRRVIDTWEAAVRHARETDTDTVEPHDYQVICKNGDERILEITGAFIGDDLLVAFYDITGRKQTETKLAASEALLSRSQEIAHIGSWNLDLTTNNMYWSDEVYRIFGCEPQEFAATYETFLDFVHPDDRAAVDEAYSRSVRGKSDSYEIEHRILRQSTGEIRHVYERCVHVRDDAGDIIQSIGMVQDITVRKAAEAEQLQLLEQVERDRRALVSTLEDQRRTGESLRESEARFRRAVTGAPFPIMIHAEDGQVVTINTPWTRLTGYEHSDIPTIADWTRKAYGSQRDLVRADIDGLYALDGPKAEGEYTIATSSGDSRIWDFSSAPIGRLPDGRRLVISMAMDVTERKQLETERQKFFLLAESSSEFIGMCDLDMNPLYVNPAGRHMVGLPDMAAACRVKVQDYYFPEDQRFIAEEFFPRVLREGHGDVEIRLRHFQTGEPIWMFYYLFSVHDASGTPVGWATVSRDITERKRLREELEQLNEGLEQRIIERTAQLEASNKELEAFAYSVSHDLRAPLRAVDGYANILIEDYAARLDDEGQRVCSVISESARTMGRLIDDLLAYSRTGRVELQFSAVDMATLARSIFFEATSPDQRERIDFRVGDLPKTQGDPTLLRQVWTNLLENAVKFSAKRERAVIEVGSLSAGPGARGPGLPEDGTTPSAGEASASDPPQRASSPIYFVRDNGAGFDMAYADNLFGVFQRIHSSREYPGTGVGLAIVQRIVQRHDGRIWAEGEVGKGATFYFTLA